MTGGEYVAAAYGVVFVFILVYVAIIAAKLARLQRQTAEVLELARSREPRSRELTATVAREATREA